MCRYIMFGLVILLFAFSYDLKIKITSLWFLMNCSLQNAVCSLDQSLVKTKVSITSITSPQHNVTKSKGLLHYFPVFCCYLSPMHYMNMTGTGAKGSVTLTEFEHQTWPWLMIPELSQTCRVKLRTRVDKGE